jgi:hypothetical protein
MSEEDNPLEGAEFNAALAKLEAGSPELKVVATLILQLRDAVTDMQEQLYSGDEEEDEEE